MIKLILIYVIFIKLSIGLRLSVPAFPGLRRPRWPCAARPPRALAPWSPPRRGRGPDLPPVSGQTRPGGEITAHSWHPCY